MQTNCALCIFDERPVRKLCDLVGTQMAEFTQIGLHRLHELEANYMFYLIYCSMGRPHDKSAS